MLTQLEFLGFCFSMLAMILVIVKYDADSADGPSGIHGVGEI